MKVIVVAGAVANKYDNGGEAWVRLSWIRGLQELGFSVAFFEQVSKEACCDKAGKPVGFDESANLQFFDEVTEEFDLSDTSVLIYGDGERFHGMSRGQALELAVDAELLVNISGNLRWKPLIERFRRKAYIDIDPGFTQFWAASGVNGLGLEHHDYHFTIGENIGNPDCPIPTGEIEWLPIRQPVVLEDWPESAPPSLDRFTTIATWRGPYGSVYYDGEMYGLKVHEFRKFFALPEISGRIFEIALDIHPDEKRDLERLKAHGWRVRNPREKVRDPCSFRSYIQKSGAEFSVAQGVYVKTRCGWFSDRSIRYLASGKPVLVQDTGFARNIPVGEGVVTFSTLDEAVRGAEAIAADYTKHAVAARSLAEDFFDAGKVLTGLLEQTGIKA